MPAASDATATAPRVSRRLKDVVMFHRSIISFGLPLSPRPDGTAPRQPLLTRGRGGKFLARRGPSRRPCASRIARVRRAAPGGAHGACQEMPVTSPRSCQRPVAWPTATARRGPAAGRGLAEAGAREQGQQAQAVAEDHLDLAVVALAPGPDALAVEALREVGRQRHRAGRRSARPRRARGTARRAASTTVTSGGPGLMKAAASNCGRYSSSSKTESQREAVVRAVDLGPEDQGGRRVDPDHAPRTAAGEPRGELEGPAAPPRDRPGGHDPDRVARDRALQLLRAQDLAALGAGRTLDHDVPLGEVLPGVLAVEDLDAAGRVQLAALAAAGLAEHAQAGHPRPAARELDRRPCGRDNRAARGAAGAPSPSAPPTRAAGSATSATRSRPARRRREAGTGDP